jgi:hypothetical protein
VVQEAALNILLGRLGPARSVVEALLRENRDLRADNVALRERVDDLEMAAVARRTMKRRSPAQWRFRVLRWEFGEQTIYPKEFPQGKRVPNLRVWIPLDEVSEGAPYWDITRKRIIDRLLPMLPMIQKTGATVEITQVGDGPTSDQVITIHQP